MSAIQLVLLHLAPTRTAVPQIVELAQVKAAFHARAGPGEAVEHVSVREALPGLYVGLYYRTESEETARTRAEELARRLIAETPVFAGWRIITGKVHPS